MENNFFSVVNECVTCMKNLILTFFFLIQFASIAQAEGVLYVCYNKKYSSYEDGFYLNAVVDDGKVYATTDRNFNPVKHYVEQSDYWEYLGNGRFMHKLIDRVQKCNLTDIRYDRPKPANSFEAIRYCKSEILKQQNSNDGQHRILRKMTLLTEGEFKAYEHNQKYGYAVFEGYTDAWFVKGLYWIICQIDLTERTAFVYNVDRAEDGLGHIAVGNWYKTKRTDLLRKK